MEALLISVVVCLCFLYAYNHYLTKAFQVKKHFLSHVFSINLFEIAKTYIYSDFHAFFTMFKYYVIQEKCNILRQLYAIVNFDLDMPEYRFLCM